MAQEYKTIKSSLGQSLINIAVQEYGCYEGLFDLIEDNESKLVNIAQVLQSGVELLIRVPVPEYTANNRVVAEALARDKVIVSSQLTATDVPLLEAVYAEGIYAQGIYE
jgi:hypothetical protein